MVRALKPIRDWQLTGQIAAPTVPCDGSGMPPEISNGKTLKITSYHASQRKFTVRLIIVPGQQPPQYSPSLYISITLYHRLLDVFLLIHV